MCDRFAHNSVFLFFHRHDIFPENLIFPLNADSCGMNSEFAIHPGAPVTTPGPQLCTSMGLVLRGWVQVVRSCLQLPTPSIREGSGTLLQYFCLENPMDGGAWKAAVHGVAEGQTRLSDFTFHFHALEKEMATHSSVLAWRIPGTGEPGGLPSMGLHGVRHD